jgi:hypothetical protein
MKKIFILFFLFMISFPAFSQIVCTDCNVIDGVVPITDVLKGFSYIFMVSFGIKAYLKILEKRDYIKKTYIDNVK